MEIINPATGKVIRSMPEDTQTTIIKKVDLLKQGFTSWTNKSIEERIKCIATFSIKLGEQIDQLASDLTAETGKPLQESINEINGSITKINFFLTESVEILTTHEVTDDGTTKEVISYDPLGVVTNISAWNYPYLVGVNIFVPALICGNCVLYKPSEFSAMTGENITRVMHESGIPQNVFQMVAGDGKAGQLILEQNLDGYFFTGSYKTGLHIAKQVSGKLVPLGLELGGKDPLYVTDELSDIKNVAQNVAEGAFYNNGQSCCSVERIYVHEKVYDEFLNQFVQSVSSLKVGDPTVSENQQGAITRKEHLKFLKQQVDDAVSKGAKIECGGHIIDSEGFYFEPTVLSNVNHEMSIIKDETFGPLIGVHKVTNDEQAISLMNDTQYGLTSAVFTENSERGKSILSKINSGTGYLNCCDRVSGHLPWSGRGHSGLGSTLSKHGLYAFCNPKGLHLRTI